MAQQLNREKLMRRKMDLSLEADEARDKLENVGGDPRALALHRNKVHSLSATLADVEDMLAVRSKRACARGRRLTRARRRWSWRA